MSNLKSTTAIFSVPKDRLGCHRTRESPGERRQPAGRTALPVPGDCSPAARKLRMFTRWPYLHRPDPSLSAGAGSAGRIAGRRGQSRRPGARPGAWFRLTAARVALCAQRVLQPRTLPQLDSDGTVYRHDVVHRASVGRGYGRPAGGSNSTWPLPPGRRLGLGLPLGPSRSLKWTRGRAPGTDPRATGPCAGLAMTASGCTSRPVRARPAGVKIFHARQSDCSHHREPTLIHITDLFPTVLLSHLVSGQFFFARPLLLI